jgi:amino acid adenylation domain-containing protein
MAMDNERTGSEQLSDAVADARRTLLDRQIRQQRAHRAASERIVPVGRDGPVPATQQQRYLWFLQQIAPGVPAYNMLIPLRLRGRLDVTAMRIALRDLIARHEGLRTRFASDHGVPVQVIDPPQDRIPLATADVSAISPDQRWQRVIELATEEIRRPFDLATDPLLRCWLAQLGPDDHLLAVSMHHIVADGWSVGIVTRDLAELYSAALAGRAAELPELVVAPADFAAWQQRWLIGDRLDRQLGYWREVLAGLPAVDFPADRPRPPIPTWAGDVFECDLPAGLLRAARDLAAAERVSLLAVLLAAFLLVLHRYTGQDDLSVGSVLSGRTRSEIERLVGFFANTLVLRASLSGDPLVRDFIARCNEVALGGLGHQDVPFGTVVEALRPERVPGRNPLFQISFTLLTSEIVDEFRFEGLAVQVTPLRMGTSRFDIAFQVTTGRDGSASAWVEFSTDLFDQARIESLVTHFAAALQAMLANPGLRCGQLEILSAAERHRLTTQWNPPAEPFDTAGKLLHDLVAEQAATAPSHPAIRFGGTELSYAGLRSKANRLAWLLRQEHAVGPDTVVGLLLDRGPELPAAQLATMQAGGAWLPLDPAHPASRIEFQLADAGAAVVVTTRALADALPSGTPRLLLDDPQLAERLAALPDTAPPCEALPDHIAYVIYTSGSTGTPKGVLVTHRGVVNFVSAIRMMFAITPADRLLQFANPSFDVSVFDIYAALGAGATLVCAPRQVLHDVDALGALLRDEAVTMADIPPAVLHLLDPASVPDLRLLFVGLEAFPAELVNRWRTPRREFHNGYGPTEVTVACVDYACPAEPLTAPPPIGQAMANHSAYVLDRDGRLVPAGVPGELCMAGVGLARGYAGRAALTAERFTPCPFGPPGTRMYHTGDLVRWRADGVLEFLGRVDRQVKIRGLRIELGEIEHVLADHAGVGQCAVVVASGPGGPRLDAYVVPAQAGTTVPEGELRSHLMARLPLHMVPATLTTLAALPLNTSGKLDIARLPAPASPHERERVAPSTPTQRELAAIWRELLSLTDGAVAADDSFFTLGGSSLQATQLISRIRDAFGVEIDPRQLFTHPLLSQLADLVDAALLADIDADQLARLQVEIAGLSEEELDRLLAAEEG